MYSHKGGVRHIHLVQKIPISLMTDFSYMKTCQNSQILLAKNITVLKFHHISMKTARKLQWISTTPQAVGLWIFIIPTSVKYWPSRCGWS